MGGGAGRVLVAMGVAWCTPVVATTQPYAMCRLSECLPIANMKILKSAIIAFASFSVTCAGSTYAQNAAIKEMQDNVLRNTGLTRQEGMLFYKVQMQCKQRGFPSRNIWNTCMQAVYVNNDLPMPSSLMGAATFAATQRCLSFKNDIEALMCAQGGN